MQGWLNIQKSINVNIIKWNNGDRSWNYINRLRKTKIQETEIQDEGSQQARNRREFPQPDRRKSIKYKTL